MFVVSQLIKEFELNIGAVVKASSYDKGCVGFMPVYETRKQAEKAYPNQQVLEVGFLTPQPKDNNESE